MEYREQRASTRPLFKWGSDICLLNRKQSDLSLLPMTGILALWRQGRKQGHGQISWEAFTNQLRFLPEATSWTKIDKVFKVTHSSLEVKEIEVRFPKCCDSARSICTHSLDPVAHPKLIRTFCQKKCVLQWVWICSTVTGNFDASFGNTTICSPCPVIALSRAGRGSTDAATAFTFTGLRKLIHMSLVVCLDYRNVPCNWNSIIPKFITLPFQ